MQFLIFLIRTYVRTALVSPYKLRSVFTLCYFRSGLTEIDCVLCGKRKKDIVKRKHKNNENSPNFRCECPDVSYCQPCKEDLKERSIPQSNGNKVPYGSVHCV